MERYSGFAVPFMLPTRMYRRRRDRATSAYGHLHLEQSLKCLQGLPIKQLPIARMCLGKSLNQPSCYPPLNNIEIPGGFTFQVHEFVLQAIKALDSGLDFSWQQRISIHHLYADILNVMETFTLHLSIPPTLPFFASPTECKGTSGIPFAAYVERDCRATDIQINHFQSITFSHRLVKSCSFEVSRNK